MRLLAPPKPSTNVKGATPESIAAGRKAFDDVGCALCHTPTLNTYKNVAVKAMQSQPVNLYSDSSDGSEANAVTRRFFGLPDAQQQDLLNFLRSL